MEPHHLQRQALDPFHARLIIGVLSLIGLFCASYLLYTYVNNTPIACGIIHGCDAVRTSSWSTSFGLPRPLFGVIFYVAIFLSLIVRAATSWRAYALRTWTRLAVLFGFIESGFLFFIQWLDVKAFCSWCLLSALCAVGIAVLDQYDRGRLFGDRDHRKNQRELQYYLIFLILFFILGAYGFWRLIG
ncbi:MAG: vitamin K epoxide reductase family protein [bacterium]|nr:vitamin K epoxide reductase family protein [bacterium]